MHHRRSSSTLVRINLLGSSLQEADNTGKILQDDKTVESYKIEEKGFIVCMTQKVYCLPVTM